MSDSSLLKLKYKPIWNQFMSQQSDDKGFRIGLIFSKQGVVILPQGKLSLSYTQVIALLASVIVFFSTAMPILSQFIPSNLPLNSPIIIEENKPNA